MVLTHPRGLHLETTVRTVGQYDCLLRTPDSAELERFGSFWPPDGHEIRNSDRHYLVPRTSCPDMRFPSSWCYDFITAKKGPEE